MTLKQNFLQKYFYGKVWNNLDIPQLLTGYASADKPDLYTTLFKPAPIKPADRKKELHNVFMDLDLGKKQIVFSLAGLYKSEDLELEKKFCYFGNNQASSKQIYIVRDSGSLLNFWFGKPKGILANLYDFLPDGELKSLLGQCREAGLFDDQGPCLDKIRFRDEFEPDKVMILRDKIQKGIYYGEEKWSAENFINACLPQPSAGKFVLIIPRICKTANDTVCISQMPEYQQAITQSLKGETAGSTGVCHVCGKIREDINTKEYTSSLSRSSIAKVFVTTTVNYSPLFNRNQYQQNYSLCKACHEKLLIGEKRVMQEMQIRVAGERCVLLFGPVDQPTLHTEKFPVFLKEVEIAFQSDKAAEVERVIVKQIRKQNADLFQFHMVFYRTDGKSTEILKTIESVSKVRLRFIQDLFEEVRAPFGKMLPHFLLGFLYTMVPICTNQKGEKIDFARVLSLYSCILKGGKMEKNAVFELAADALEKGFRELTASKIRNYHNLYQLDFLAGKEYGREAFLASMVMMYIALFEVLQKLQILKEEVFQMAERSEEAKDQEIGHIAEAEKFLKDHGFSQIQKSLFYVGALAYQVGICQFIQGHRTKPILNKLSYVGMSHAEVEDFYFAVMDKTRQYRSVISKNKSWQLLCEILLNKINENWGGMDNIKKLTEKENIFYILSGYAFFVKRWTDQTDKAETMKDGERIDDGNGEKQQ